MNKKIRVAIIGVGNCASSLVQGVEFYRNARENEFVPGLMHVNLGGYHVRDIEFSAAFDVNHTKVGKDLSQAIFAEVWCLTWLVTVRLVLRFRQIHHQRWRAMSLPRLKG